MTKTIPLNNIFPLGSIFEEIKQENTELKEQNAQLKELLKECKDVAEFTKTIVNKHKWLDDVVTKINQALGEDK